MGNMKKYFLNDLVKIADDDVPAPVRKSNSPSQPQTPVTNSPTSPVKPQNPQKYFTPTANKAIADMQKAIQSISFAVTDDAKAKHLGRIQQDTIGDRATGQQEISKKGFNDFIAEQYMGTLDTSQRGSEFSEDPNVTSLEDKRKSETGIYEQSAVMNTISRIGNAKSEIKPDGVWSARTDNALRNILAFAYALLQVEGDFGLDGSKIYSNSNLKAFTSILNSYKVEDNIVKLSNQQKEVNAKRVMSHIMAIQKLYENFRNQVGRNAQYRMKIEGHQPFIKFNKQGTNPSSLSKEDLDFINQKKESLRLTSNFVAPSIGKEGTNTIPLEALLSKENYLNFMKKLGNSERQAMLIFDKIIKPYGAAK